MERKKSTLTPENYIRAILALSKRFSSTSTFPGNNYFGLAEWLLQDRDLLNRTKPDGDLAPLFASKSEQPHDLVVVYNSGEKKWDVQQYTQEQHDAFSATAPATGLGQLVFLRGFISPSWVSVIGSKYHLDPEFFRRHLDFLSSNIVKHAYSFPSLASSSDNIFRLCVNTIFHRDDLGGQNLRSLRSDQITELERYKIQQLGSTRVCCGDSLVRQYSTLCSSFSVVEQWISFCIAKTEQGWTIVVWMDQGRPLEQSPPGPWTHHIESKATPLPILQHHHKMAFRTTTNRLDPAENASADIQQSTTILPLQYDSMIALVDLARRAPHDPMSMCIPLFAHSAFSEVQFLNLMEFRIQTQMASITEEVSDDALENFQYFSIILNRHAQQLDESTRALCKLAERSSSGQGWSAVKPQHASTETETNRGSSGSSSSSSYGSFTTKGLLEDYEKLHVRCTGLSKMCSQGITLAMNRATIQESRKAIEQSERVKKLTVLATLFIPLSFCTSLFGMNVDILGQSEIKFWWFFVFCGPITFFAYGIYLWDFLALKRRLTRLWKSLRKGYRTIRRDGKGEKEAVHMV